MKALPDVRTLHRGIEDDELLNSASAIAFQVLSAAIPLALFTLALVGFLDLEQVWRDAAAALRPKLSPAAFTVLDTTVRDVIDHEQPFWLTLGAALTLWRISSAMRAVMGALDRIYGADRERPLLERLRISIGLALAVTVLLLAALAVVHLGGVLVPVEGAALSLLSGIVRWALAGLLLLLALGLTIHHGPVCRQPLGWVSFGSVLAVFAWLLASAGFALYVGEVASFSSLFGSFTTAFVLLTYLYVSAFSVLLGVEIDAQVRRAAEEGREGQEPSGPPAAVRVSAA